jgi:hypothetical protein
MFLHTCMWFPKLFEMVQLWGSCSPKPSNHWTGIIPNCRYFEIPWKGSNWHDYHLRPFYSIDLYCIHLNSAFTSFSSACFKWTTSSCLIKYRPRSTKAWRKKITVEQQKIATWKCEFLLLMDVNEWNSHECSGWGEKHSTHSLLIHSLTSIKWRKCDPHAIKPRPAV